jgi:hypothetical protein
MYSHFITENTQASTSMALTTEFINANNSGAPSTKYSIVYRCWSKLVNSRQVVESTLELKQTFSRYTSALEK